jgi:hypothetical protein
VSFLSQPTHFIRRVEPDIFDGITLFHRNKHSFVAYDKLFLETSQREPILPIQVPLGEDYSSIVMKKPSSIPCLEFKFPMVLNLPRHLNR